MCTYNVRVDDHVVELMKPHFDNDKALQLWIEKQLQKAMWEYAAQFEKPTEHNDCLLEQLMALDNSPEGFLKLDTVLSPSTSSIKELREEAFSDKYGI